MYTSSLNWLEYISVIYDDYKLELGNSEELHGVLSQYKQIVAWTKNVTMYSIKIFFSVCVVRGQELNLYN